MRLADVIGRRVIVLAGLIGIIISVVLMHLVNTLYIVYALVLLVGLFHSLRVFTGYILSMELMLPNYRKSFHMAISVADRFTQIFVALSIYFSGEVNYIIAAVVITSATPLIFIHKAPESPEFLYKNKKWDQLHEAFRFISRYESTEWKNVKFQGERNLQIVETNINQNCFDVLRDTKTMRNLFIMCINWST